MRVSRFFLLGRVGRRGAMKPSATPGTLEACSTPSPSKATVFNVAEYKRQQQQQQKPKEKAREAAGGGEATVTDLSDPGQPLMKCEAKYDFKGDAGKKEMSFEKGDFITVFGKSSMDGWWVGRLQGEKQALYFPFNYVKFVKKF